MVSIIDGSDPEHSNHLRYINCACNESEQNLVAYQFKGKIFYRTVRDIERGEELLIWYGKEYAKNLGIVDSSMSLGTVVAYLLVLCCMHINAIYVCMYVRIYMCIYNVYVPTPVHTYLVRICFQYLKLCVVFAYIHTYVCTYMLCLNQRLS